MERINSKQELIRYFEKGCKKENQLNIGVEHEKFIFENITNQRASFKTISKILGLGVIITGFIILGTAFGIVGLSISLVLSSFCSASYLFIVDKKILK